MGGQRLDCGGTNSRDGEIKLEINWIKIPKQLVIRLGFSHNDKYDHMHGWNSIQS